MPFFDNYPYTNLHNVNLDWVLQKVKTWGEMVEQNNQNFIDLQAAYNAFKDWLTTDYNNFKDYVTTYLENLDVQQEINNKLDDMLASGELTPYLSPYVAGAVGDWLAENMTTTSPPVDKTLTIPNAAADAEVVGNELEIISDSIEGFDQVVIKRGTDVLPNATKTTGAFKNVSGTDNARSDSEYYTLSVSPGEEFYIEAYAGIAIRLWLVFSSDGGNAIAYSRDGSTWSLKSEYITIPANGATLVVNNIAGSYSGYPKIEKLNDSTRYLINSDRIYIDNKDIVTYIDEQIELGSGTYNVMHEKILCCVGDSITRGTGIEASPAGDGLINNPPIDVYQINNGVPIKQSSNIPMSYGYQIAVHNNMIYYVDGINGTTMTYRSGLGGCFSEANGRYTKLPTDIDYLTIWFGWNDYNFDCPLGTISDTVNTTFYGAYNVVLPYLINKYPNTKIALIVQYGTDANYRQAIRDLANKWGLACFDMFQAGTPLYYEKEAYVNVDPSIVTSNRAKFQGTGTNYNHPNYKGHTQIADMLEHFLKGI